MTKSRDDMTDAEIDAEIARLEAEAAQHAAHAGEMRLFAAVRRARRAPAPKGE